MDDTKEMLKRMIAEEKGRAPLILASDGLTMGAVQRKIGELETALADTQELCDGLSGRLEAVVNAFHDGPKEHGLWSFHDLPQLAQSYRTALKGALVVLRAFEEGKGSPELARDIANHCESVLENE